MSVGVAEQGVQVEIEQVLNRAVAAHGRANGDAGDGRSTEPHNQAQHAGQKRPYHCPARHELDGGSDHHAEAREKWKVSEPCHQFPHQDPEGEGDDTIARPGSPGFIAHAPPPPDPPLPSS